MKLAALVVAGVVAFVQTSAVALFLVLAAVEGDSLGIARGMALVLAVPVLVITLPAILLARAGWSITAIAMAMASAAASWLGWWTA